MSRAGAPGLSLADFVGLWRVDRVIEDRRAGQAGVFEGTASFHPDGAARLRYEETGRMRLGDAAPMQAARVYLWRFEGARVEVSFEDGRPFHGFALAGQAHAAHWCDPDNYRVAYDFAPWPEWRAEWEVHGPRKDYRLTSRYRRP